MALVAPQPAPIGLDNDYADAPDVNDDLDDLFRPMEASIDRAQPQASSTTANRTHGAKRSRMELNDLGLNEEIQVSKKRKPIAKLDDERLLSQAGIPKLRRIVQERLKFKGKGHEFSDISRMLNLYQLWLDDLYPRAKFADGLAMIEKLGHSKRMNVMRKEWIKEKNSSSTTADTSNTVESGDGGSENNSTGNGKRTEKNGDEEESLFVGGDLDIDADLLLDLDEQPDEDELDALLSAEPVQSTKTHEAARAIHPSGPAQEANDAFEDQYAEEMMMMNDMQS